MGNPGNAWRAASMDRWSQGKAAMLSGTPCAFDSLLGVERHTRLRRIGHAQIEPKPGFRGGPQRADAGPVHCVVGVAQRQVQMTGSQQFQRGVHLLGAMVIARGDLDAEHQKIAHGSPDTYRNWRGAMACVRKPGRRHQQVGAVARMSMEGGQGGMRAGKVGRLSLQSLCSMSTRAP